MVNAPRKLTDIPKEILEVLYSQENVYYSIKKSPFAEIKHKFIVITDRRVIFLDLKVLGRYDLHDIPYSKLEHVVFEEGLVKSEFDLKDEDGHHTQISWLDKKECEDAIITIRDALNAIAVEPVSIQKKKQLVGGRWVLHKPKEVVSRSMPMAMVTDVQRSSTPQAEDPMDKLKRLKNLHDEGILSDEEYQEKKQRLMDMI